MNLIKKTEEYEGKTFDSIKHIDQFGNEYWKARELQKVLEYTEWRKFENVICKAKSTCDNSGNVVSEHFVDIDKTINMPKGAKKTVNDYYLSRYACYLIVQNGVRPIMQQDSLENNFAKEGLECKAL